MNIFIIAGLAIAVSSIILLLKELKPEFSVLTGIAFGIIVIAYLIRPINSIIDFIYSVAEQTGLKQDILVPIIKIFGISIVAEFAASVCTDAGQNAIASKVESAGKITVLTLSLPVITQVLNIILDLLN